MRRGQKAGIWLLTLLAALAHLKASAAPSPSSDTSWRRLRAEDGITSLDRSTHGRSLPEFRAQATMEASIWDVLSVLEDVDRAAEWTAHCQDMHKLPGSTSEKLLVYARMDAPWPVRDRDVITKVETGYASSTELVVKIASITSPQHPVVDGVVRIPRLIASYSFRVLSPRSTQVAYQLDLDPGGTLPDWLKTLAAKDLAHQTLSRLRDRVAWARQRSLYRVRAEQLQDIARAEGFEG
jgi:hypothetical protein